MKRYATFLRAMFIVMAFILPAKAYANITITPTIVVFEDRDRFKDVTLINTTDKTNTYEIYWTYYRMVEGAAAPYEPAEKSITEFDLAKYVVFTPRRVTIGPSASQKVRLALRRPAQVPPGEYRAHMNFRAIPELATQDTAQPNRPDSFSPTVNVNVAYSIPIVFNAGAPNVQATIDSMRLERNQKSGALQAIIKVSKTQNSAHGAIGHLKIYNAKNALVGEVSNANIFSEINQRIFKVPLITEDIGNQLRIVLERSGKNKGEAYAQKIYPIQ